MPDTSGYVEILISEDDLMSATYAGVGKMVVQEMQKNGMIPVLVRVTANPDTCKPWACDNESNFNRLDYENHT